MSSHSPKPKVRTSLVIDADTILYAQAAHSEICARNQGENGEDLWLTTCSLEDAYRECIWKIEDLREKLEADDIILCFTGPANFRKDVLPTYKASRANLRRPSYLQPLKDQFCRAKPYSVHLVHGLEADDLCGIAAGALSKAYPDERFIIVSDDKDLRTVPGWLYHKEQLLLIPEEDADYRFLWQALVGDPTDNYSGCKGVGPKNATAILEELANCSLFIKWQRVLFEFEVRGHSEEYALTQARCARILRVTDWDPSKKEVILWTPPETP